MVVTIPAKKDNPTYCWWFRNPKQPPVGCIVHPVNNGLNMVKLPFPQLVPPKYVLMGFAPGPYHLHDRLQDVSAFHDNLRPKLSGPCGRTSTEEDAEIDAGGSWGAARPRLALDNQLGDETWKKGTLKWTLGKGWRILVYILFTFWCSWMTLLMLEKSCECWNT